MRLMMWQALSMSSHLAQRLLLRGIEVARHIGTDG